ncbi:MAG: hypothetical protein JSC085_000355 [Candidatus Tokpelaia sp. JSC085]|nr:MAG: hypothetical protein JSC085_000355 [Candidatus Tokpelaia sp. JSC085]
MNNYAVKHSCFEDEIESLPSVKSPQLGIKIFIEHHNIVIKKCHFIIKFTLLDSYAHFLNTHCHWQKVFYPGAKGRNRIDEIDLLAFLVVRLIAFSKIKSVMDFLKEIIVY